MADEINPGEFVTFVRAGGLAVTVVRYNGAYVRIATTGGRLVTHVHFGGIPVVVDDEKKLPDYVKEEIGIY